MGSWFSNLHIRKKEIALDKMMASVTNKMLAEKYVPVKDEAEADLVFLIAAHERSDWYSVYSDYFAFEDPVQFTDFADMISGKLDTDVLGISCFDSDYLYLNLINKNENINAWANTGSAAGTGIRRRMGINAWKSKVNDFSRFKESLKAEYVFAEEVLDRIEECLSLPAKYSRASAEDTGEMADTIVSVLYFKLQDNEITKKKTKLIPSSYSVMPFCDGKPEAVSFTNIGGASKGFSLYFAGPFVENEEIRFDEVSLVKTKNKENTFIPIELHKTMLPNGNWVYAYHDPSFKIMPKVSEKLPLIKIVELESERNITIRFIPRGNNRKMLDVTIVIVPDENPEGAGGWNLWAKYGSKSAYIKEYNNRFGNDDLFLKEEDFD